MFLFEVIGMGMDVLQKYRELNMLCFAVIELRMQFWVKKIKYKKRLREWEAEGE